ncbi:MAG TPA: hypothetical protein VFA89_16155 [Terriglobales bacterium]|nr:hypothetical protein [Terriglobales bacterium]
MPLANTVTNLATKPLPNIISPKTHAIIDFVTIGSFFLMAATFWRRSKRAAISALICGGAELAVSLLTDYPGGVAPTIDFATHGKIDSGLAAMTATMPEFLAFPDEGERFFFLMQGSVITAVTGLTDFDEGQARTPRRSRKLERAA